MGAPNHRWSLAALALLLCGFCPGALAGSRTVIQPGSPYTIDVWDSEDGLPQNSVISLIQTRDGYLWLGTLKGLVRFDGIRFSVFSPLNTPGLRSSSIVRLFEDSQANLWIGTEAAGVALVRTNGQIENLNLGRGERERRVTSICEDTNGVVWLYSTDGQLGCYRQGKLRTCAYGAGLFSNYRVLTTLSSGRLLLGIDWTLATLTSEPEFPPTGPPVEQSVVIRKLDFVLASPRGGFWCLADGRIQKWDAAGMVRDCGPYPWKPVPVSAACEDREGNLIVGTLGEGAFWFDAEGKVTALSTNQGLSHNIVLSLCMDREGSLWVGTDGGGLNRVKRQVFSVLEDTRGLVVHSVCENVAGDLWIGFNAIGLNASGAGLLTNGVLRRFGGAQGLLSSNVRPMLADRSGRVWAGTLRGLFEFEGDHFQREVATEALYSGVLAIYQDRAGRLWFGTQSGLVRQDETGWKTFKTRDGTLPEAVLAIADDEQTNLWVSLAGGGLFCLTGGQFTNRHAADGFPRSAVTSLLADADGALWIGTDGDGLGRLKNGEWTRFSMRDGLASDNLAYLIEDDQGCLWIGSNAGLMRVRKKALSVFAQGPVAALQCRVYHKSDGLPMGECTFGAQPAACRTRDGKLWFPTINGLASVNPAQLESNTNPPPVVIESVRIEGVEQITNTLRGSLVPEVTVAAGQERVEIRFTSLNLAAPERARFKFRLDRHETKWTEAGDARVAHYTKLPPGKYQFKVSACNEDGVWNEVGCTLGIIVEPPFWQTWWFLTATGAALLGAIVGIVHYFSTQKLQRQLQGLKQKEALEKERSRIARDIHDQVGANLTRISLLSELVEADKDVADEVETHAQQIIQTSRDTTEALDEIVWAANPSNDSLDSLITYICKNAQEYLSLAGLRYRLDVPDPLPATPIPPDVRHNVFLASKEAVTNVVRHAHASEVHLRLRLDRGEFLLEIEDNGRGLPPGTEASDRNGLRNMRKRMEDVGGRFSIGPADAAGTRVRLAVPLGNR